MTTCPTCKRPLECKASEEERELCPSLEVGMEFREHPHWVKRRVLIADDERLRTVCLEPDDSYVDTGGFCQWSGGYEPLRKRINEIWKAGKLIWKRSVSSPASQEE